MRRVAVRVKVPKGVTAASLVDAMATRHAHMCHILDLASPDGRVLWGPAATIRYIPYRVDVPTRAFSELYYRAVGEEPGGKVLVLGTGGQDAAVGGATTLSRAHNDGLAGVLTDARLRDFKELGEYGFATWCRGEDLRAGGDTVMPWSAGDAVEVAGVTILPGDWIYADRSGAVVLPGADVDAVVREARRIEADGQKKIEEIRHEARTDGVGESTESA